MGLGQRLHLVESLFPGRSKFGLVERDQCLEIQFLKAFQPYGLCHPFCTGTPKGTFTLADQFEEHRGSIPRPSRKITPRKVMTLLVLDKPLPHELTIVLKVNYRLHIQKITACFMNRNIF